MGFLLGAFGKQMAGTRYRSLQSRMMRLQGKVRRVHREVESIQKAIDGEKKSALNEAKFISQQAIMMAGNSLQNIMQTTSNGMQAGTDISKTNEVQYAQVAFTQAQAKAATELAAKENYIEQYYERLKDQYVDPLKDEEEELQSEKDMLDAQIALAKEDYEACKKMEQADIKMLTPNYTGGQG